MHKDLASKYAYQQIRILDNPLTLQASNLWQLYQNSKIRLSIFHDFFKDQKIGIEISNQDYSSHRDLYTQRLMKCLKLGYILFQCVGVLCREFQLNRESNGACLKIDAVSPQTQLDLILADGTSDRQVPLIVFNYLDLKRFSNLPNLDEFLRSDYGESDLLISGKFNLKLKSENEPLPVSVKHVFLNIHDSYSYNVTSEGTYCVYAPSYKNDDETRTLPFKVDVSVENEPYSPVVGLEYILHGKICLTLTGMMVLVYLLGNRSAIDTLIRRVLEVNFGLSISLFACECFIIFYNGSSHGTKVLQYLKVSEIAIIDSSQEFLFLALYMGYGTGKFKLTKLALVLSLAYYVSLVSNHFLTEISSHPLLINSDYFEVLYDSIIVKGYKEAAVSTLAHIGWWVNILSSVALFTYMVYMGVRALDKNNFKLQLATSLVVHLFIFKLIVKQFIVPMLSPPVVLRGVADIAQGLSLFASISKESEFKYHYLINLSELLVVWMIWCRPSEPTQKELIKKDV